MVAVVSARRPSRKQARRDALFLLYQRDVTGLPLAELLRGHELREGYPVDGFTLEAVQGVEERREELDRLLAGYATDWPPERMGAIERNVLRLALWEMLSGTTPVEVAVDEAVRLARRYSLPEAGPFVNGVLGAVARERLGGDAGEGRR